MLMYQLIRSLGLVAYLTFSLSLALGLASVAGGVTDEAIDRRLVRQFVHRSAAVVGLIALGAHLTLTVLDTYVKTPLTAVLVPFTSGYEAVALGIGSLAMYAFVAAATTGWLRARIAERYGEGTWRLLHRVSYVGWALCLLHGILAGPDASRRWALATYAIGVLAVGAGLWARVNGTRHVLRRDEAGAFRVGGPRW